LPSSTAAAAAAAQATAQSSTVPSGPTYYDVGCSAFQSIAKNGCIDDTECVAIGKRPKESGSGTCWARLLESEGDGTTPRPRSDYSQFILKSAFSTTE